MPASRSHASSGCSLRQFEGGVGSARKTAPRAAGRAASWSVALQPTIPMCGNVKVMIWPA